MVTVTAEGAKAEAAGPVKGKPRGLPADPPTTYDAGDIAINADNFPDAEFQKWLKQQSYGTDGTITQAEIAAITRIDVHGETGIKSLTGIEHFTALETLDCSYTGIGSLDVSSNKNLTDLQCAHNASLTSLTVEGATALKILYCYTTGIRSLDVSSNTELTYLNCSNNPLAYLNIGTNNKLTNVSSTGLKPVEVTVPSDRFQMADKFAGIDAGAVDDKTVRGADYDKTTGTMSNYRAGTPIKYTYHCGTSSGGKKETIEVTLNIKLESTISITENLNNTYTVEEKALSGGVKDSGNNKSDGTKTDKKAAQTGDHTSIGLLAAMILLSAGCMFLLTRKEEHKK